MREGRTTSATTLARSESSFVKYHTQQGIVYLNPAVVFDESQLPKFVHEEADPAASCADHFSQSLLRNWCNNFERLLIVAISGDKQQGASQPLLTGIEKLIRQVLFDAHVAFQHMSDEAIRELVFFVNHPNHFSFLNQ